MVPVDRNIPPPSSGYMAGVPFPEQRSISRCSLSRFQFYLREHLTHSFERSGAAGGACLVAAPELHVCLPAVSVLLG